MEWDIHKTPPLIILFFVSLLIGPFGCAHMSPEPYQQTWVCSADGPDFDTTRIKGKGLRVAKDFTLGLTVDTGTGAVIGGLIGAVIGTCLAVGTSGAGIALIPYFAAGGAAIGGAVGGISGAEGGPRSTPSPDNGGITYDTWKGTRFVQVDSLKPTLQWKPFPTAKDIEADPNGDLSKIREVTYDLKVWKKTEDPPGDDIIYRRTHLESVSHKIESPLVPLTRYFWSVRVRFKLDSRDLETNWSTCCPFYTTP